MHSALLSGVKLYLFEPQKFITLYERGPTLYPPPLQNFIKALIMNQGSVNYFSKAFNGNERGKTSNLKSRLKTLVLIRH